jgi:hypothetical protein
MLGQYIRALKARHISYKVISKTTETHLHKNEMVLLTMCNKFRLNALKNYMNLNKHIYNNYRLILDESDQYIDSIKHRDVFKHAKYVLHVTATPFRYTKNIDSENQIDKTIILKTDNNYVGLNDVNIIEIIAPPNIPIKVHVHQIIRNDFMLKPSGIMLINCFPFVKTMKQRALEISTEHFNVPVVVISSNKYMYINGIVQILKINNIQKLFDQFNHYHHVIFIANRLSNRGINYTNSEYSRHVTHQISLQNNCTGFIQKCRIFGLRPDPTERPSIYCLVKKQGYIMKLKDKIENITNKFLNNGQEHIIVSHYENLTVVQLKKMCKENQLTKYSKLKKAQLIELLTQHNIAV